VYYSPLLYAKNQCQSKPNQKVFPIINNLEGNIIGESFTLAGKQSSPAVSYGVASTNLYPEPQGVIL